VAIRRLAFARLVGVEKVTYRSALILSMIANLKIVVYVMGDMYVVKLTGCWCT